MRKKSVEKWICAALGAGVLGVGTVSVGLASFIMHGKRQTLEEARKWQDAHYETDWYDGLKKVSYEVKGYEDYILHVEFCENPVPSRKYIILTHGYTDNHLGMLKYMRIYLDRGYNCILYDLRGHGENKPTVCTYGILEGRDLYELILDTRKRYPDLEQLGLHGESLGSATTVTALGCAAKSSKHENSDAWENASLVDFAVADCGFADIENVLRGAIQSRNSPQWLFDLASAGAKVRYGIALKEMRPIDCLYENTVPILFLHGEEDRFILPSNSERMYHANAGYGEYYQIPGAGHAESVLVNPQLYRETVYAFLNRVESLI